MSRKTFLSVVAVIALSIGSLALLAPEFLLNSVKSAKATPAAEAMARTVGVLLCCVGVLNAAVRKHPDSSTMRTLLGFNAGVQFALLPLDPIAFALGAFEGVASFAPNSVLHVILGVGFVRHLRRVRR